MDQDLLTNGALGALWKRDQIRRLSNASTPKGSITQASPSFLAIPGFLSMSHCPSPKRTKENVSFPHLQLQSSNQKRKANWPKTLSPPSNKRTKYSLKEMAEQFTASQIELAARSVMLPRPPNKENKLPGISQSLNVFMSPNPEKTVVSISIPATPDEASGGESDLDMSWLEPTPILDLEPTPLPEPTTLPEPAPLNVDCVPATPVAALQEDEPSLLHRTVGLFPTNYELVKGALDLSPQDVGKKIPLPKGELAQGSCGYPLNIAIEQDASLEVIQLLANAAPDIISQQDGTNECGSLSLLLKQQQQPRKDLLQILNLLVKANPMATRAMNPLRNSPLHIALASESTSLEVVRELFQLYPPALLQTNKNGDTPLQVARRTFDQSSEVLKFVQDTYNQELRRLMSSRK